MSINRLIFLSVLSNSCSKGSEEGVDGSSFCSMCEEGVDCKCDGANRDMEGGSSSLASV